MNERQTQLFGQIRIVFKEYNFDTKFPKLSLTSKCINVIEST